MSADVVEVMDDRDAVVSDVLGEIEQAIHDADEWVEQARRDWQTRNCLWAGKSEDFRKHAKALGREVFPWEGASQG